MPSSHRRVDASGIPNAVITRPAGASPQTAWHSTRTGRDRRFRTHAQHANAAHRITTKEPPVDRARVTIEVLNAGSDVECSTYHTANVTTAALVPAASMRKTADVHDTASGS